MALGSTAIRSTAATAEQPAVPTSSIRAYSPKSERLSGSAADVKAESVFTGSVSDVLWIHCADPRVTMESNCFYLD
ncbi:hypothetical protein RISK_001933 [Rhodopirellula islandica]|uniref:Uncharacterized protein n=1 Tax=Rhodopirellula islandica TaxID=595434 RepID=A0A0J1BHT8_RHOIS|nr:hypothetical protein RISK_001933 [Rhodopirellula islandica]